MTATQVHPRNAGAARRQSELRDLALAIALARSVPQLGRHATDAELPESLRQALKQATPAQLQTLIIEATIRLSQNDPA